MIEVVIVLEEETWPKAAKGGAEFGDGLFHYILYLLGWLVMEIYLASVHLVSLACHRGYLLSGVANESLNESTS